MYLYLIDHLLLVALRSLEELVLVDDLDGKYGLRFGGLAVVRHALLPLDLVDLGLGAFPDLAEHVVLLEVLRAHDLLVERAHPLLEDLAYFAPLLVRLS